MPEPERDRYGRYMLPDPITGEARGWTRATTLSNTLKDGYGLNQWAKRMVVLGIAKRPDLYDLAMASDEDDKQQLDQVCEDAMEAAKAGTRANQGTALHKFTQRLDAGEDVRMPARWQPDIDAYQEIKERYGIQTHPTMLERITVVPSLECAGTMDKVVKHNDQPKIADLKTGGTVFFSGMEIAMQLAIYAHGEGLWNFKRNDWDQMPKVSQSEGLVIHLPAGGDPETGEHKATLYSVDLVAGWKIAQVAYLVRDWRKDKDLLVPYNG